MASKEGVLMLASTNRADVLDKVFLLENFSEMLYYLFFDYQKNIFFLNLGITKTRKI